MKTHFALALALVAFASAPARAQSQDEQNACMNDAFSVCGHAIPDRDRVAACLAQNIDRISVACRTVMARYSKPNSRSGASRRERGVEREQQEDRDDPFFQNDGSGRNARRGRY